MDEVALRGLMDAQSGVVSRSQLRDLGASDNDIARMVRRRDLTRVHQGVYVNHTGPLWWVNRAWAAVLFYWPAALCDMSAIDLAGDLIHVAVAHPRSAVKLSGVRLHRLTELDRKVLWNMSPPRFRVEEAALDVAAQRGGAEALALLGSLCQRRRTTPRRLLAALEQRRRMRQGAWLRKVLDDVASGALSVLESTYLHKVERAHGLPRGRRQPPERTVDGGVQRDVVYDELGLVVELDGRLGHEAWPDRWSDMDRDLLVAIEGRLPLRLGWRHAEDESCRTAVRLAVLMQARGWTGQPRRCRPDCPLPVGSHARRRWDPTD